ncbi:hypothetical protein D3C71_1677840 [compost metagenome]
MYCSYWSSVSSNDWLILLAVSTYWLYLTISAWAVLASAVFASGLALSSPHAASINVAANRADMHKGRDINIYSPKKGTHHMPPPSLTRYKVIQTCHKGLQSATTSVRGPTTSACGAGRRHGGGRAFKQKDFRVGSHRAGSGWSTNMRPL